MPSGRFGSDTPDALDQDAADLSAYGATFTQRAESVGAALTLVRERGAALGEVWHGPRAEGLIGAGGAYLDGLAGVVGALESIGSTASSWSTLASTAAADLRRWMTSVDNLEAELAGGVEYPGQASDLVNARGRVLEIREQCSLDCTAKAAELSSAISTLDTASKLLADVGDTRYLSDEWYFPALAAISVGSGLDLSVLDPTGGAGKAAAEHAAFMGTEDGAGMFLVFDVANQNDLDKADGNLSTDDIEAACDPLRVEAILRQAAEANGFDWDEADLQAMVAQITSTAWLLRADNDKTWEDIDDEVGMWDTATGFVREHVFAPVVGFTVGAICYTAAAGTATATGGVSLAAAGYCGGLAAAAGTAAQNWVDGEGLDGVIDGLTDPGSWILGAGTGVAFQGATNFLLRTPTPPPAFTGAIGPDDAYHYTFEQFVDDIAVDGLGRRGANGSTQVFLTPDGELSPLQAQLDLALPPNQPLRNAVIQVDLAGLRAAGFEIPAARTVTNVVNVGGRVYTMPGGGREIVVDFVIPPEYIKVVLP